MALLLEQDFLAGALLNEIIRQHPEIRLSPTFVETVLVTTKDICDLFEHEAESVNKRCRRKVA